MFGVCAHDKRIVGESSEPHISIGQGVRSLAITEWSLLMRRTLDGHAFIARPYPALAMSMEERSTQNRTRAPLGSAQHGM